MNKWQNCIFHHLINLQPLPAAPTLNESVYKSAQEERLKYESSKIDFEVSISCNCYEENLHLFNFLWSETQTAKLLKTRWWFLRKDYHGKIVNLIGLCKSITIWIPLRHCGWLKSFWHNEKISLKMSKVLNIDYLKISHCINLIENSRVN